MFATGAPSLRAKKAKKEKKARADRVPTAHVGECAVGFMRGGSIRHARQLPLDEQLAKLTRLRLCDVPRLQLFQRTARIGGHLASEGARALSSEEQRQTPQRTAGGGHNAAWVSLKRGCLTSSKFAAALGFHGDGPLTSVSRQLAVGGDDWAGKVGSDAGCQWGDRHEASGLATYLGGYVAHACPEATATETGFWPFKARYGGVEVALGASPDALLQVRSRTMTQDIAGHCGEMARDML
jgi:hypothetical protein